MNRLLSLQLNRSVKIFDSLSPGEPPNSLLQTTAREMTRVVKTGAEANMRKGTVDCGRVQIAGGCNRVLFCLSDSAVASCSVRKEQVWGKRKSSHLPGTMNILNKPLPLPAQATSAPYHIFSDKATGLFP